MQPTEDLAYTIVAEPIDRTGFARATLAPRPGMSGALPPHRLRPIVSMAEMGMNLGPKGYDRGTRQPEQDMPGHVTPEDPVAMEIGMGGMGGMSGGGGMQGMQSGSGGMQGGDAFDAPGDCAEDQPVQTRKAGKKPQHARHGSRQNAGDEFSAHAAARP